jgi:hypothetical protein
MALRAIWQFMEQDVTHKIVYGPQLRFGPYNILWVINRSINCNLARSVMNYLLYYIISLWHPLIILNTCKSVIRYVFCYCISKTKNEFGQNPEENIILTGPGQYTSIWTGSLLKTNRENISVTYNIWYYYELHILL